MLGYLIVVHRNKRNCDYMKRLASNKLQYIKNYGVRAKTNTQKKISQTAIWCGLFFKDFVSITNFFYDKFNQNPPTYFATTISDLFHAIVITNYSILKT